MRKKYLFIGIFILFILIAIYFWNIVFALACNSEKIDIRILNVMLKGRIKPTKEVALLIDDVQYKIPLPKGSGEFNKDEYLFPQTSWQEYKDILKNAGWDYFEQAGTAIDVGNKAGNRLQISVRPFTGAYMILKYTAGNKGLQRNANAGGEGNNAPQQPSVKEEASVINSNDVIKEEYIPQKYNPKKIEEYYPLYEGYSFEPRYVPDYINYCEKVIVRYNNLALVTQTHGGKSSDIKVYEVDEDVIYELLSLEDDSNNNPLDYNMVIKLIIDDDKNKLCSIMKELKINDKKIVLKSPFKADTVLDKGRIVEFEAEPELKKLPEWLNRGLTLPDKDVVVVRYDNYYKFFKKGEGIVMMYYQDAAYETDNIGNINGLAINDSEVLLDNKAFANRKYNDIVNSFGKPLEIKSVNVKFPASEEDNIIYILRYSGLDIEMYPVDENTPVSETEAFRFDILSSEHGFYGIKIDASVNELLNQLEDKRTYWVKEVYEKREPIQIYKILSDLKEAGYYREYEKAIYIGISESNSSGGRLAKGIVLLINNDKISRIVYGFPTAS